MKLHLALTGQSISSIRLFTAVFSLLLSVWAYHAAVVLNADGILYIYTIDAFKAGGLAATESLYNWPFFPILTGWLSEITGWNTEFSVKALNSVLFMLLTDALVLLSHKSLPNLRQVGIAAVLILAFATLNNYRDFIIRDIGYWAFACYALYQFIQYLDQQKIQRAILWQLLMVIALLFRIEAVVLLAAVPLYVLISDQAQNKWRALLQLYSISIAATVLIVLVALLHPDTAEAFSKLQQLSVYLDPAMILAEIQSGTALLEEEILHPAADEHAGRVLISGLVLTVLWELVAGISIPYLILLAMAWFATRHFQPHPQQKFFIFIVLINVVLLSVFAVKSQLITTRYCILGLLFLILALLPTMTAYISSKFENRQKKVLIFIGFLVFASVADTLITTKAKPYLKTIPAWAAQNLPEDADVVTTHFRIEYYFNKYRDNDSKIQLQKKLRHLQDYDYLITYLKNDENHKQNRLEEMGLKLIKEAGNGDNRVSVYAISPE